MVKNRLESKISPSKIPKEASKKTYALIFYEKLISILKTKEELSAENLIKLIDEYQQIYTEADFDLKTLKEAADFQYLRIRRREKRGLAPVDHEEVKIKFRALRLLDEAVELERKESE